jgi:uncharacterized protein (TIGR02757 family)
MHARLHPLASDAGANPGLASRSVLEEALPALLARHGGASPATDPVEFPRRYPDRSDAEAVAFVAAAFAFGNVRQIRAFLESLLPLLGERPASLLASPRPFPAKALGTISHRFISTAGVHRFLAVLGRALRLHGSLEGLFLAVRPEGGGTRESLSAFLAWFRRAWGETRPRERDFLFPDPAKGSACKRHNLFLRWVVRPDDGTDLGLWTALSPAELLFPVDTHVARLARQLGLTSRASAGWAMAEEVTEAFRAADPDDPVRFDFALTRVGILGECTARRRGDCPACPLLPACSRAPRSRGRRAAPRRGLPREGAAR